MTSFTTEDREAAEKFCEQPAKQPNAKLMMFFREYQKQDPTVDLEYFAAGWHAALDAIATKIRTKWTNLEIDDSVVLPTPQPGEDHSEEKE
jgi:hypothetical protein